MQDLSSVMSNEWGFGWHLYLPQPETQTRFVTIVRWIVRIKNEGTYLRSSFPIGDDLNVIYRF